MGSGTARGTATSDAPDDHEGPRVAQPGRRLRLTARGRRALLAAVLVGMLAAGAVAVRFVGWPDAWLPAALAGPPCTVSTASGDRALDVTSARRLADAALAATTGGPGSTGLAAPDAAVVDALRTREAALSCRLTGGERQVRRALAVEQETASGLTPRAETVRSALLAAAGRLPLGGFAPGGVTTGHMPGSAHYEGRAVDVFFRPADAAHQRHGWLVAQWLVAHAGDLDVDTVIYDDRIWSASASAQGWRPYVPPQGPTTNPVLRHLDHVHVDVVRGAG